jgi:hypothetical protein
MFALRGYGPFLQTSCLLHLLNHNMDCSTCKAFDATENMHGIHSGTCHRHAPAVFIIDTQLISKFPVVYLPEFCLEYVAKD